MELLIRYHGNTKTSLKLNANGNYNSKMESFFFFFHFSVWIFGFFHMQCIENIKNYVYACTRVCVCVFVQCRPMKMYIIYSVFPSVWLSLSDHKWMRLIDMWIGELQNQKQQRQSWLMQRPGFCGCNLSCFPFFFCFYICTSWI